MRGDTVREKARVLVLSKSKRRVKTGYHAVTEAEQYAE